MLQKRTLIGLFLVLAGLGAFLWLVFGWPYEKGPKPQAGISWSQARWSDLPGWGTDDLSSALAAFHKSCARRLDLPEDRPVTPSSVGGVAGDWAELCQAALALDGGERDRIRVYFEDGFTPVAVMFDGSYQGLFTGYYEPLIHASRTPDATHNIPLYRRPPELVTVDLGHFREDLAGRRIAGEVVDGRLRPFASRAEIEAGALANRGLELLWADDPVDVFFLQIQGSGRARLPDGSVIALGYDGPNGHAYTSLGRLMVTRKILPREQISAPAIADWLRDNPVAGADLMAENASYVFFRQLEGDGPLGAEGVALTEGRSLAVDRAYLPLGAPLWLDTTYPDPETPGNPPLPLQRLMIAQDTGGAIRGGVRGDVFWGFGEEAAYIAGHMANKGRFWLLLPNALADKLLHAAEPSA